jgi:NAD(P)H-dependent FMN reductase
MTVLALSGSLRAASINSALLIASPEYAHGVSGAIKNALDWLVGFEPSVGKPVVVLNASPRAHHADDALRETLRTMSAVIVESASVSIPLLGVHLDESTMLTTPPVAAAIRESLCALQRSLAMAVGDHSTATTATERAGNSITTRPP